VAFGPVGGFEVVRSIRPLCLVLLQTYSRLITIFDILSCCHFDLSFLHIAIEAFKAVPQHMHRKLMIFAKPDFKTIIV
jgi:hypothetical protein